MLIEKIEFKVYILNDCIKFAEKYILIHPRKTTTEFLEDLEEWEEYKRNIFNSENVSEMFNADIERQFEIFWTDMRGYCIVFNNDAGIRNTEYRAEN
jgi:hypothetical protein